MGFHDGLDLLKGLCLLLQPYLGLLSLLSFPMHHVP